MVNFTSLGSWLSLQTVISVCMWASLLFYWFCFFPQILTNYRRKDGTGISELMLLGYLNSYLFLLFYIFCLPLPFAYRLMVPLHTLATLIIIGQRLYYDPSPAGIRLRWVYLLNIIVFTLVIPVARQHPFLVGATFGWCNLILCFFNQLPQVLKVHRSGSVAGFSFLFVLFTGLAAALETIVALVVGLPAQTMVNAMRGVILFLIFCGQFWLYRVR